jgi:hypothetical protein
LSGYNQIQIALEDQDKMTFTCPWGTLTYCVLPFGLCNAPATFHRVVLGTFFDIIHDCVEMYMDEFTTYGDELNHALENLEKTLIQCKEAHVALSNEKCQMMLTEGIVLGNHILAKDIHVDKIKIKVIVNFPIPTSQKQVRSFIGYIGYYRCFIKNYSQIACSLFSLLTKDYEFLWTDTCQHALDELKIKVFEAPVL